jgi:hypothetical protein
VPCTSDPSSSQQVDVGNACIWTPDLVCLVENCLDPRYLYCLFGKTWNASKGSDVEFVVTLDNFRMNTRMVDMAPLIIWLV